LQASLYVPPGGLFCDFLGYFRTSGAALSRGCRIRQAVEHQEFGRFFDIARHGGKTVKGQVFRKPHKSRPPKTIPAFIGGKGSLASLKFWQLRVTAISLFRAMSASDMGWPRQSLRWTQSLMPSRLSLSRLSCEYRPHQHTGHSHPQATICHAPDCHGHCPPSPSGGG